MKPPFYQHPLIRRFNILKQYFRKYETLESRSRIKEFRNYARLIQESGNAIAFDFLGSINFGQATRQSDADLVLYLDCGNVGEEACQSEHCPSLVSIQELLEATLRREYPERPPYEIQVVDCINLAELKRDLEAGDAESATLLRFAFYRSVCWLVNARLIRPYHMALIRDEELMKRMEPHIHTIFDVLVRSPGHTMSLKKYQERIRDLGVEIPAPILKRISDHLSEGDAREE